LTEREEKVCKYVGFAGCGFAGCQSNEACLKICAICQLQSLRDALETSQELRVGYHLTALSLIIAEMEPKDVDITTVASQADLARNHLRQGC
jgi:hypothetical protein